MSIHTQGFEPFHGYTLKKHAFAVMLAAGVSIFAIPAQATIIVSPTGNCNTTGAASGTATGQLTIGCVATGSLDEW
jgi:hypothetical protein